MLKLFSLSFLLLILVTGCKFNQSENVKAEIPTEEEKVEAIKDMLKAGLDKAVKILSTEDGFLNNDSLKITLPEEAGQLVETIKKLPQGNELITNALTQINQVAGNSIEAIAPVVYAAIDSLSVEEANRILLADSAAATAYPEKISRAPLQAACEPIILQSLDKKIFADVTTRNTWGILADNYNKIASSKIGQLTNLKPAEVELDEFVTEKILDAVFYLIAQEEMNIRKHPGARISKSLAKSFGWIDGSK